MRTMMAAVALAAVFAAACGSHSNSITAPTTNGGGDGGSMAAATRQFAKAAKVSAPCKNADPMDQFGTSVQWASSFGQVTVHNDSVCTNDYSFVVHDATQNDVNHVYQAIVAYTTATLQPGETQTLTLGFTLDCSKKYQRDLIFGYLVKKGDTPSDYASYPFYAPGGPLLSASSCDAPPAPTAPVSPTPPAPTTPVSPTPPVDAALCQDPTATNVGHALPCTYSPPAALCQDPTATNVGHALPCTYNPPAALCQDPKANNVGHVLPCTYNSPPALCQDPEANNVGQALPCTYTPPPVEQKLQFCHVSDQQSGYNEEQHSIPLSAIQNAHIGPGGTTDDTGYPHLNWRHDHDYMGVCDGRSSR